MGIQYATAMFERVVDSLKWNLISVRNHVQVPNTDVIQA